MTKPEHEIRAEVRRRLTGRTLEDIERATSETGTWLHQVRNCSGDNPMFALLDLAETELSEHERIGVFMREAGMDVYDPEKGPKA